MLAVLVSAMFALGAGAMPVPIVYSTPTPGYLATTDCAAWQGAPGNDLLCPYRQAVIRLSPEVYAALLGPDGPARAEAYEALLHELAHAWDLYDNGLLDGSPRVPAVTIGGPGCVGPVEQYACESARIGSVH